MGWLSEEPRPIGAEEAALQPADVEAAGDAFVSEATAEPMPFATGLFGRHVGGCPSVCRPLADILFSECQPKIDDVRLAVAADQDVARLHIPMDESLLVGVVQGVRDGGDKFGGFPI